MVKVTDPLHSGRARGAIGETTYNENRGIKFARRTAGSGNYYTPEQIAVRAQTTAINALWGELSTVERTAWAIWAERQVETDWTGKDKKLTGFNWFVRLSTNCMRAGVGPFTAPPSSPWPLTLSNWSIFFDAEMGDLEVSAPYYDPQENYLPDIWGKLNHKPTRTQPLPLCRVLQLGPSHYDPVQFFVDGTKAHTLYCRIIDVTSGLYSKFTQFVIYP
jgi:hypothetical protein